MMTKPKSKYYLRCYLPGCERPATRTHIVLEVPTCGFHNSNGQRNRKRLYANEGQMQTRHGEHKGAGVLAVDTKPRAQARWSGMATSPYPTAPLIIKNAVAWCETCKTPIERRFRYCQDCIRLLSSEGQQEEIVRLRSTRRIDNRKAAHDGSQAANRQRNLYVY